MGTCTFVYITADFKFQMPAFFATFLSGSRRSLVQFTYYPMFSHPNQVHNSSMRSSGSNLPTRMLQTEMKPVSDRAGEVVVVCMLVARLICALHSANITAAGSLTLTYEKWGLLLLTAAALAVDSGIVKSSLLKFTPRLNASSGVLLGAVTLPLLFAARLVEFVRLSSPDWAGSQAFRFQFWIAICCSFRMVLFSADLFGEQSKRRHYANEDAVTKLHSRVKPACLDTELFQFVGLFFLLSILPRPQSGLGGLGLGWMLMLAAFCKAVLKYILESFPGCASPGEAMLVTGGLVLCYGHAIAYVLDKVSIFRPLLQGGYGLAGEGLDVISALLQAFTVGLLLVPWTFRAVVSAISGLQISYMRTSGHALKSYWHSAMFLGMLALVFLVFLPFWLCIVRGLQESPILWVVNFMLQEPLKRGALFVYWVIMLTLSIYYIFKTAKHGKEGRIIIRKYYHILAVIIFAPGLLFQPDFLRLAFAVAFAAFLVVEMVRIWRLPPVGQAVHEFMKAFTDSRDSDLLIISHFSLLLGCALPLWFGELGKHPVAPFAGVISLGIGDTVASMVGVKYGHIPLGKTSRKTVEGTVGGIVSMLVASFLLSLVLATGFNAQQFWSMVGAVTAAGLLEAYTTQLDNAFMPLLLYTLLLL